MSTTLSKITIANYRSIYQPQTIGFDLGNARTIALYGQNASGKSNILKALKLIADIMIHSADAGYELSYDPFHYSKSVAKKPTIFNIRIKSDNHTMEYAFAYNTSEILYEILQQKSHNSNKYKVLFLRKKKKIVNSSAANYGFGQKLLERTLEKTLLLTKAYEDNNIYARFVFDAIQHIEFVSMDSRTMEAKAAIILNSNPDIKKETLKALSDIEPSVKDIQTSSIQSFATLDDLITSQSLLKRLINSYINIKIVRKYGDEEYMEDISNESSGTRTILSILTMFQYAKRNNLMLCVDEFGNYMHPFIAAKIIDFYEKLDSNKNLLITTHQLGLYDHIGRSERVIVRKNQKTGETYIEQKKPTNSPRALREDRKEADKYFVTAENKNNTIQSTNDNKLFDSLGL